jgi:hypothetical protein
MSNISPSPAPATTSYCLVLVLLGFLPSFLNNFFPPQNIVKDENWALAELAESLVVTRARARLEASRLLILSCGHSLSCQEFYFLKNMLKH